MLTQQNDLMVTFYEILLEVLGFHRIFWKADQLPEKYK